MCHERRIVLGGGKNGWELRVKFLIAIHDGDVFIIPIEQNKEFQALLAWFSLVCFV